MPTFFVEDENFEATVNHLLENGRFNEVPTRPEVEQLLKSKLAHFYPDTFSGRPEEHCECIYQSVFCMPCRAPEEGPNAYVLNLVCRLRTSSNRARTKI